MLLRSSGDVVRITLEVRERFTGMSRCFGAVGGFTFAHARKNIIQNWAKIGEETVTKPLKSESKANIQRVKLLILFGLSTKTHVL